MWLHSWHMQCEESLIKKYKKINISQSQDKVERRKEASKGEEPIKE